jgi:hypothetical protein
MKLIEKIYKIFIETIPVLIMIGLIPLIKNDYSLTLAYIVIIAVSLLVKYEKKEYILFIFGFIIMIVFESIFISTGVEVFERNSLFGLMPLWLPFLWAYGFIAIKRCVGILK